MQVRQFVKFFKDDEVFKIVTVDQETNEAITLMNFFKRDLPKIERYFNSVLDCNIQENNVEIQGAMIIIHV